MKKALFFATCLLAMVACDNGKTSSGLPQASQNDSLQKVIEQKDNEINDMMGILNEVEEGFRLINEAENRVSVAKNGEGASRQQQIRENMQFIQQRMAENRELIAKLRNQVKNGSIKSEQLQKTIENMAKQLEEKDHQIKDLYAQLEAKDIHIEEPAEHHEHTQQERKHTARRQRKESQHHQHAGQTTQHGMVRIWHKERAEGAEHPR